MKAMARWLLLGVGLLALLSVARIAAAADSDPQPAQHQHESAQVTTFGDLVQLLMELFEGPAFGEAVNTAAQHHGNSQPSGHY